MRLTSDDQAERLKGCGYLDLEVIPNRQLGKIVRLTFWSNCPENVRRIIGAQRLRMTEILHLQPDAGSTIVALDLGLSHRLRIKRCANYVDRGIVVIFVPDCQRVTLGDQYMIIRCNAP